MTKSLLLLFVLLINTSFASEIEIFSSNARENVLQPVVDKKNLSGLTLNPYTNTFFAIINKGDRLYEFDANFRLLRSIVISGFNDPEDLCFVTMTPNGPVLAIADEVGTIRIGVVGPGTELRASNMRAISLVDEAGRTLSYFNNKGLEGITYIPAEDKFLVVQEKPIKIWSFKVMAQQNTAKLQPYVNPSVERIIREYASDLSAITYNAFSNEMVLLSDESSTIIFLDHATTNVKRVIELETRLQHEGMAFSKDFQSIFVGSEPYYLLMVNNSNIRRVSY